MLVFPEIPQLRNIPPNPLTRPHYRPVEISVERVVTVRVVLKPRDMCFRHSKRWNVRISCTVAVYQRTQKNVQRRGSQTLVNRRRHQQGTRFGVCALHFDDDWLKAGLPAPSFEVCGSRPYIFSAAATQERVRKYRSPNFLLLLLWSQLWGDCRRGRGTLWPKCIMYIYIYLLGWPLAIGYVQKVKILRLRPSNFVLIDKKYWATQHFDFIDPQKRLKLGT